MAIDIKDFMKSRMAEFDDNVETRAGTPFGDLFINSLDFILQPFVDQLAITQINQSLRKILALEDPDSYSQEPVDDFGANIFVSRREGNRARVVAKVFYSEPLAKEFPANTAQITSQSGLNFFNYEPFSISQADMSLNRENGLYFFEMNVEAEFDGEEYNIDVGDLVSVPNDPDVVRVTNESAPFVIGNSLETNTSYINRMRDSIGVRDLNVGKGINAILFENFPLLNEIQPIGFKYPEMMRDILFNAHAGGYTDIYVKVPQFTVGSKDIIGITFDTTREIKTQTVKQIASTDFDDLESNVGNPFIVFGTLTVKESKPEQAAFVDSVTIPLSGIDLTNQNQYIKLQIDSEPPVNIKVSGAIPTATSINEIVNSINAAIGFDVAKVIGQTRFRVTSLQTGAQSQIIFTAPDAPRDDATNTLFGFATPNIIQGFVPIQPIEGVDFEVDYDSGKVIKLPSATPTKILSGEDIMGPLNDGQVLSGERELNSPFGGFEINGVEVGDSVHVTGGTNVTPGIYIVTSVIDDENIQLDVNFFPSGDSADVEFFVRSNKVYAIDYSFNPLSVDIGNLVKLDEYGAVRGIRDGREDFTITDMAFIDLISIEEIDPDTLEGVGTFLLDAERTVGLSGFGAGGYGEGPYGIGSGAQFYMEVNSPHERFSAFEDSLLLFDPTLFGKSYRITYFYAPEIPEIHDFVRKESERVTDSDILVKHFIPAFVDFTINYTVDPTNTTVDDNDTILINVTNFIQDVKSEERLESSDIIQFIEQADFIEVPFTLSATVIKPNGSSEVLESEDFLEYPDVEIPSETNDPTSKRIVRFYPRNITLNRG